MTIIKKVYITLNEVMIKERDDLKWEKEKIYLPFDRGDQSVIIENQRTSKINFRNLILIKKNINWLNETLKRKETLLDEIFYAFYYNENLIIIKKSNIDK